MAEVIIVAGPDRVGKTTFINKNIKPEDSFSHFGPPDRSWTGLFHPYKIQPGQENSRVIWWDRSHLDHLIYEKTRRGLEPPVNEVVDFHRQLSSKIKTSIILIVQPWQTVRPRHIEEIISEGFCTDWFLEREMALRKLEHELYYEVFYDLSESHNIDFSTITF